jgi:hypothetical protein
MHACHEATQQVNLNHPVHHVHPCSFIVIYEQRLFFNYLARSKHGFT